MSYASEFRSEYIARASRWSDIGRHLIYLYETASAYAHPVIIELGVRSGVSTTAFLRAAAENDGHVHSVDIHHPDVPIWWAETDIWSFTVGDDLHPSVLRDLPDVADVVFIDTSHHYGQTLSELQTYVPRVRSGGVVLLHDTELAMPEGFSGEPYPVRRAIDDYCAAEGRTWENRPGDSGLGVICIAS